MISQKIHFTLWRFNKKFNVRTLKINDFMSIIRFITSSMETNKMTTVLLKKSEFYYTFDKEKILTWFHQ